MNIAAKTASRSSQTLAMPPSGRGYRGEGRHQRSQRRRAAHPRGDSLVNSTFAVEWEPDSTGLQTKGDRPVLQQVPVLPILAAVLAVAFVVALSLLRIGGVWRVRRGSGAAAGGRCSTTGRPTPESDGGSECPDGLLVSLPPRSSRKRRRCWSPCSSRWRGAVGGRRRGGGACRAAFGGAGLAVLSLLAVMANVQGAVAPLSSLLPMVPRDEVRSRFGGALRMGAQGARGVAGADRIFRYHAMAVVAGLVAAGLIVAAVYWRRTRSWSVPPCWRGRSSSGGEHDDRVDPVPALQGLLRWRMVIRLAEYGR